MKIDAGELGEFTFRNTYRVHTNASIQELRNVLVPAITGELGHALLINAEEYKPQPPSEQPPWFIKEVMRHPWFAAFCVMTQVTVGAAYLINTLYKVLR